MHVSRILIVAIIFLAAVGLSCERTTTEFNMAVISDLKSIPLEYGALISVTTMPEYPGWAQMWFQDSQGVIRIVRVQVVANLIHNDVKVITRN